MLKIITFVLTLHTLIYFGMQAGFLTQESGDNPHKSFVDQFLSGEFSDSVNVDQESGIISGTISLATQVIDFIGFITGITISPVLLFIQSPLPAELKLLFGVLLSFLEIGSIAYFIRGIS